MFCIDWKRWWQTQKGEQLKKQMTVRMQLRKAAKFPHARCIRSYNKPMKFSYQIEFHFEWYQCSILHEINRILKQIIMISVLQKSTSLFIIFKKMQQSWTKLFRHFGMNENFDLENHLQYHNNSSPLSTYQCCFATKITLMIPQSFQTTLSEGKRRENNSAILLVFPYREIQKYALLPIAFVSTSFVQDCSLL